MIFPVEKIISVHKGAHELWNRTISMYNTYNIKLDNYVPKFPNSSKTIARHQRHYNQLPIDISSLSLQSSLSQPTVKWYDLKYSN